MFKVWCRWPKVPSPRQKKIKIQRLEEDDEGEVYQKKLCNRFGTREEEEEQQIEDGC